MKRKNIILNIILFLFVVTGYSYFRSYIDQVKFIVALDSTVSLIIAELWKLASSPTIFISLIVVILILSFKENLLMIFPAIKEIKAGSFSAIIDYSKLDKLLSTNLDGFESAKDINTKKKQEDVTNYLLDRLGKETLLFFLEIDGKPLEISQILKIAESNHVGENSMLDEDFKKLDSLSKFNYLLGNFVVLIKLTFPAFFYKNVDDDGEVTRTLKEGIRTKIEARLKLLDLQEVGE